MAAAPHLRNTHGGKSSVRCGRASKDRVTFSELLWTGKYIFLIFNLYGFFAYNKSRCHGKVLHAIRGFSRLFLAKCYVLHCPWNRIYLIHGTESLKHCTVTQLGNSSNILLLMGCGTSILCWQEPKKEPNPGSIKSHPRVHALHFISI